MKSKGPGPLDGVRAANPHSVTLPSFHKQNRVVGTNKAVTSSLVVFSPSAACTVQWMLVQTSAAVTIQVYLNGQPYGAALSVNANSIIRFAGTLLANNEVLSLVVSGATNLSYELAWLKEFALDLIVTDTAVIFAGSGGAVSVTGQVGLNKNTTVETIAPLAANATFTGNWHDSQADGTTFVIVTSFSNVAGAASGLSVDLSDDITNANFTRAGVSAIQPAAATLTSVLAPIRARYWRVTYHNGATLQASLEVTACAMDSYLPVVAGGGTLPAANFSGMTVSNSQGAVGIGGGSGTDNLSTWVTFGGPAPANLLLYGGAFSAAADAVRQGASKARTPTVFRQVSTAALGSVALWTPGTGNKFRLLRYRVMVGASAIMAAATDLTLKLLDSATDIGQDFIVRIPVAALGSGVNYDSGWVDLGFFGILSAAANNVLNANLSAALTGGLINFLAAGTEE